MGQAHLSSIFFYYIKLDQIILWACPLVPIHWLFIVSTLIRISLGFVFICQYLFFWFSSLPSSWVRLTISFLLILWLPRYTSSQSDISCLHMLSYDPFLRS